MAKENVAIAKLKYLHMAPRKVRLVANSIKGKHVIEAEAQLVYAPQRAAKPLLKLLRSAANNASNKKYAANDPKKENNSPIIGIGKNTDPINPLTASILRSPITRSKKLAIVNLPSIKSLLAILLY